ncbi:unnamed protein product [Brassicogethes aeneus]|uniref:Calponin-homology (CH) domain-containing protein n=1 Tax=Brassicogethes aeneus TaxID=1431903 RepID=A0A9P0FND6_BRAAE|nr:unnamed protein product [Brassicogethes aeneus]
MSVDTSRDVKLIQDEDLLRKMWHDTSDFGRKKEIRTHMYKLREARLKDFYSSTEISNEIHKSTERKTCDKPTHADSLVDHSFLSLKSKEVRDSESPTRDMNYKITEKHNNNGWNIVSSDEVSRDGKTYTTKRSATTSGSQNFDGGKVDYAARNDQKASVYKEGDDNNFTKSVGAETRSVIQQEAVGGDDNSNFRSSSTKTSSSSKVVTESRSTSGDVVDNIPAIQSSNTVTKQLYGDNIPAEVKKQPGYVEGRTKVYRETKTLEDGSTVTKTRYETLGESTSRQSQQVTSSINSSSTRKSNQTSSNTSVRKENIEDSTYYEPKNIDESSTTVFKTGSSNIKRTTKKESQPYDANRKVYKETKTLPDGSTITTTRYETTGDSKSKHYTSSSSTQHESHQESHSSNINMTNRKNSQSTRAIEYAVDDCKNAPEITVEIRPAESTSVKTTTSCEQKTNYKPVDSKDTYTTTKTTTIINEEPMNKSMTNVSNERYSNDEFINIEKQTIPQAFSPDKPTTKPEQYQQPDKRQPIKPHQSELNRKPEPTEGQYDTTYRSEFINKKISVEVNPTHDAFARSLRSVTPDRVLHRSSLRSSSNSLRSSTSPEKNRHSSRYSPDRKLQDRSMSPRKSTDRFSSTETITNKNRPSPKSPERHYSSDTITRRTKTTKEIDSNTITKRKENLAQSRSPSPTTKEYIRNIRQQTTDLDEENICTTVKTKNVFNKYDERPTSLEIIATKKTRKITDRSPTSPLTDLGVLKSSPVKEVPRRSSLKSPVKESSPIKKDLPKDKPFKRTDTYEERCRQILGITETTSERRRSSLEKLGLKRDSLTKTTKPILPDSPKSPTKEYPTRKSPTKEPSSPTKIRKSPVKEPMQDNPDRKKQSKDSPSINEFPSQIRKSPNKEPLEPYPEKRRQSKDSPSINEFPSQIRKSPNKEPLEPYPEKQRPGKDSQSTEVSSIRKLPTQEPLEPYLEKKKPIKSEPSVNKFDSQIKKSPQKEPLEPYPEKNKPTKSGPSIDEFPSQIKRTPEREPLEPYPEKQRPGKKSPSISEFPSQIRKSPEKEPLGPYPEKQKPEKMSSSVCEFPFQIRKSPEREPLEDHLERKSPERYTPTLSEFPSQVRKTPEREPLGEYPKNKKPTKESAVLEFPSQSRKSPKKNKPKEDELSSSSSSSSSEEEVDEIAQIIKEYTYENSAPVNEPPVTEKFISQLCKDEEMSRTSIKKKNNTREDIEKLIESEVVSNKIKDHRVVKKDEPEKLKTKTPNETFIQNERSTIEIQTKKSPSKPKIPENKVTTTVSKIFKKEVPQSPKKPGYKPGITEYTDKYRKPITSTVTEKIPQKTTEKITLWNVENLSDEEDTSVHIRTHRVDNTLKKSTKIVNETKKPTIRKTVYEIPKITQCKKISEPKKFSPIKKTFVLDTKTKLKPKETPISPKKVSTTITLTPTVKKTKPITSATSKNITTSRITKLAQQKPKQPTKKPLKQQNGHISTDDESEVESVVDNIDIDKVITRKSTQKSNKVLRTTSDQIFNTQEKPRSPIRGNSKPELLLQDSKKKCVTTKSITINNKDILNKESKIIIDLLRSTSSREPTPDRLCPLPVDSDEDGTSPRYPDVVIEPDDCRVKNQPKKLSDIPIFESEDNYQFTRITDITDNKKITEVDRVDETDDSLMTVDKKISKFLSTAKDLSKNSRKPAPKVERPTLVVDEDFKSDECLLSVSDKVTKFISTAEQLIIPKQQVDRPKSPICKNFSEVNENINVSSKVSLFTTTAEDSVKPKDTTSAVAPKVDRPELSNLDENIKEDVCLLSVSDKVTKFISTADALTSKNIRKSISEPVKPKPISRTSSQRSSPQRSSPTRLSPDQSPTKSLTTETEQHSYTRSSPEKTPEKSLSNQYASINKSESRESKTKTKCTSPDRTPKSTNELTTTRTSTSTFRTNDSVKKAKSIFENISREQEVLKQRDILSRPSVFEGRRLKEQENKITKLKKRLSFSDDEETTTYKTTQKTTATTQKEDTLKSTKLVIDKMIREKSPEKIPEIYTTKTYEHSDRESSPEGDLPHYMKPLDRSLRPNSPHRDAVNQVKKPELEEEDVRPTKFGVKLKRTDSGKFASTSTSITTERRKSSITLEKRVTEDEIDEIFELDILEELLIKVVGYDLRRKIRAQLRLVKKLIQEKKLSSHVTQKTKSSPKREPSPTKFKPYKLEERKNTEYQTEYTRKTSPERKPVNNNKLYEHTDLVSKKDDRVSKTEYQTSYTYDERRSSTEYRSKSPEKRMSTEYRSKSPEKHLATESRLSPERKPSPKPRLSPERKPTTKPETKTFTTLKKTSTVTKNVTDDQPEWVKKRNLRKINETSAPIKRSTVTTTTTTTTKKGSERSSSPIKDIKPTDIITSSYGVGPTDENGTPLFGLRALRAQNKTEKTKVQGTVIRSKYYSENGGEPVGQVSVTKYSNDPEDLGSNEDLRCNKGISSVTTTQKFGSNDKKKTITKTNDKSVTTSSSTATKFTRRGSVKAMSQKFIDNAVETLKSERQSSYPKAGLILRTSSFKDTGSEDDSPVEEKMMTTVTTKSSRTIEGGESFLTNRSKVTGLKDVICMMKAEDYEDGDTEEDVEARSLLNKFIGSQVILSGMENRATSATSSTTTSSTSPTSTEKRTTRVTSTITEGGKHKAVTRVFQRPVSEKDLETVWDEQTLRLLLEQSQDYEERRLIRSRLRQIMAEQEACAELVKQASQDNQTATGTIEEKVETSQKTFSTGPVTTTQVTTKVTSQQMSKKPISPFAKFRQLDKQNSLPSSPSTPKTPTGSGPLFKFTDPALSQSASTIKDRLLYWCKQKTKEYENIQLDNFSTSWADGLAFCALIHHFLPDAFDYQTLSPKNRRHNFTLAFQVADEKADIAPLLDVDDMVACRKPDWKCVFTYVQSIYRRFKDED